MTSEEIRSMTPGPRDGGRITKKRAIGMNVLTGKLIDLALQATPTAMGGTPDLFAPEDGWETWEQRTRELVEAMREQGGSTCEAPIPDKDDAQDFRSSADIEREEDEPATGDPEPIHRWAVLCSNGEISLVTHESRPSAEVALLNCPGGRVVRVRITVVPDCSQRDYEFFQGEL